MGYDPDFENQQTEQTIIQEDPVFHELEIPFYLNKEFEWWWTGVFVPIVIAWIIHKQFKKKFQHTPKKN